MEARASTGTLNVGATRIDQRVELSLPEPRQEVASAAVRGLLYVIGGFDERGIDTRSVYAFDGKKWSAGPRFPVAIDHATAATVAGTLYVVGGFHFGQAEAGTFRLSFDGRRWLVSGSLHHARGALALVSVADALFAIGGKDASGTAIGTVEEYNTHSHSWHDAGSLPAPRDHLSGFAYAGSACVAGGRSPTTSRVDCFTPGRRIWKRLPDLPAPTSGAGAAAVGISVLVGGGENAAEGRMIVNLFRLRRGHWSGTRMLIPRHGIQFVLFLGRVWACGGAIRPGVSPVRTCTSLR